ncbi:hypothetical protein [Haloquadratum walsbyi]|jgi:hypothetical protein|uniref:Uncharacterized protein n=1 Tax=Haloquadratum walsbyi J07HQW2 TaxID=1238425 RepID=U1NBL9_9EURY|nr:hypothetical protein [Haloquadratum walsbyi]ERG94285.1 MAG: hypothetical protein J07HQW2_00719 [Haloquadratum walsbyi J07HQW2]
MAYVKYEPEPGETKEALNESVKYDERLDAFVIDGSGSNFDEKIIPREKVYEIQMDNRSSIESRD